MSKRKSPVSLTPEIADAICERICEGKSLSSICRDEGMPSKKGVMRWLARGDKPAADLTPEDEPYVAFRKQYEIACEMRAEHWADEILEIADDGTNDYVKRKTADGQVKIVVDKEHIARSRLRVDSRKWLMAKQFPKKYGERYVAEHVGRGGGPIEHKDVTEMSDAELYAERDRVKALLVEEMGLGSSASGKPH